MGHFHEAPIFSIQLAQKFSTWSRWAGRGGHPSPVPDGSRDPSSRLGAVDTKDRGICVVPGVHTLSLSTTPPALPSAVWPWNFSTSVIQRDFKTHRISSRGESQIHPSTPEPDVRRAESFIAPSTLTCTTVPL